MAVAVPFLAALGGGSALTGGLIAASTLASVYTGVAASQQARNAGQVAQQQYKAEARQESNAARGREIERRRALLNAISSQNAAAAAGGITLPMSVASRDIKYFNQDLLTDRANTSTRQSMLKVAGKNAVTAGNAAAVTSLVDTAQNLYTTYGGAYGNAFDKLSTPAPKPAVRVGTKIGPR